MVKFISPETAPTTSQAVEPISDAVAASPLAFSSPAFNLWARYQQRLHRLPQAIDELGFEMGLDVINMMCNDPQISGPLDTVIYAARSRGMKLTPRYKRGHPLYAEGIKAYDEAQWLLEFSYDVSQDELEVGFDDGLEDHMRGMITVGAGVAEIQGVYKPGDTGRPKEKTKLAQKLGGLTLPRSLRTKSPCDYQFVINASGATKYIAIRLADVGDITWLSFYSGMPDNQQLSPFWLEQKRLIEELGITLPGGWGLLSPSKFVVLTNKMRHGDPRGHSALRPAYAAWYMTMLLWPEYHKFLRQCATPGIYVEMPPGAIAERDPKNPGKMISPEDKVLEAVSNYEGGGILIGKNGMKATPFWSMSDGTAFSRAFETLGREKARAIQMSILQSDVAHNNTRAASQTHKDIGDLASDSVKKTTQQAYYLQYFRRFFQINHGELYARLFTPFCGLGELAREDKAQMVSSMGSAGYKISPSQLNDLDVELEMPERSEADVAAMGSGDTQGDPQKTGQDPQNPQPKTETKPKSK